MTKSTDWLINPIHFILLLHCFKDNYFSLNVNGKIIYYTFGSYQMSFKDRCKLKRNFQHERVPLLRPVRHRGRDLVRR